MRADSTLGPGASRTFRYPVTRQPGERRAGQPGQDPVAPELRAEFPVKADRGRIPIQHRPFHAPAAAALRDPRQAGDEGRRRAR